MPTVHFSDVSYTYFTNNGSEIKALANITMTIRDGEFVCLFGPSGCGKSTLLHLVAGFLAPTSGKISLDEKEIEGSGADRAVVFQKYNLFPWRSVKRNVEFGSNLRTLKREIRDEKVKLWLSRMNLESFEDFFPAQLSSGMQQRVAIARAFANDPSLLLMDEPLAALDAITARGVRALVQDLCTKEGKTVLFVTHDIDEAILLSDRIVLLSARPGTIVRDFRVSLPKPRNDECLSKPDAMIIRSEILQTLTS